MKEYQKVHREKNREWYNERARRHKANRSLWIDSLKDSPCKDCGNKFLPCAMDFDHVIGEKKFTIAACKAYPKTDILAEIEKCELVCANCHRIRTWKRANKGKQE